MVWGAVEAVSYAREIGRPLGLFEFFALFFRESIMFALGALAALVMACAQLWRLLRRLLSKGHGPNDAPRAKT